MTGVLLIGKLSAHGDFVTRGLDGAERDWWDERLSIGMADARAAGADDFDARCEAAGAWAFRLRLAGRLTSGAIGLSRDRVGRRFPVVLARRDGGASGACAAALVVALAEGWPADALVAAVGEAADDAEQRIGWWPLAEDRPMLTDPDPAGVVLAMTAPGAVS